MLKIVLPRSGSKNGPKGHTIAAGVAASGIVLAGG
jgi:hypothetical protein